MKKKILRLLDWSKSWFYYWTGRPYWYGFTASREPFMRQVARAEQQRLGRKLDILEIGSFRGHSAVLWEEFGVVTCIDPWKDPLDYDIFRRNLRLREIGRIITFHAYSQQALGRLAPKSFDLIYVDGDHSYAGCLYDLKASTPLLRDGGVLCGDDFKTGEPGVVKAATEYLQAVALFHAFYAARYKDGVFIPLDGGLRIQKVLQG